MARQTALVTGANGFVGCHVVRALLEQKVQVRALVRKDADVRALEGLDCDRVIANLRDAEAIGQAVRGCDTIYHVAADYRLWVLNPASMYAANVEGTRNIIQSGPPCPASWIIHTSTVGALGICLWWVAGRKDTPVRLDDMVGPYKRSKFLAEQLAIARRRARGCQW